jgi:hypothetical protein
MGNGAAETNPTEPDGQGSLRPDEVVDRGPYDVTQSFTLDEVKGGETGSKASWETCAEDETKLREGEAGT